jgi:hypothetical protein
VALPLVDRHYERLCRKLSADQVLHEQPPFLGKEETFSRAGKGTLKGVVVQELSAGWLGLLAELISSGWMHIAG